MKFTHLLPVTLFTAILLFSCDAGDREAGRKAMADSMSDNGYAGNPLADSTAKAEDAKNKATAGLTGQLGIAGNPNGQDETQQAAQTVFASSAAQLNRLDSTHRFIRTADIRFRVNNVAGATYRIEDLTSRFGGYVADTRLTSNMESQDETPVSADSSLETMRYVVTNEITLRIPVQELDTLMKSLVPLVDYLDYRNISTKDVTLQELANRLEQMRVQKYTTRVSSDISRKSVPAQQTEDAENGMMMQQENSDRALLDNLRNEDQVHFSTVTIHIYQRENIRQELVKRAKAIDAYEPGLGAKLKEAFRSGWHGLSMVLQVVVVLWPLWLIIAGVWIFLRWLLRKKKVA